MIFNGKTNIINKKVFKKMAPDLFVEICLDGLVQCMRVIKQKLTPTWDEDLIL
jgi:C2 domain